MRRSLGRGFEVADNGIEPAVNRLDHLAQNLNRRDAKEVNSVG